MQEWVSASINNVSIFVSDLLQLFRDDLYAEMERESPPETASV